MFNLELIQTALGKVRSGADFPAFIQEMKSLGVANYVTYLTDGHSDYRTKEGVEVNALPKYPPIAISEKVNPVQLKMDIADHQQGKSDYFGIIKQCASNGVKNWAVNLDEMTCTYFDKKGSIILVEQIPDNQKQKNKAEQIRQAHRKVKSGADFPAYIQDLKKLGIACYETFVSNGNTDYYEANSYYKMTLPAKYEVLAVAEISDGAQFKADLKAHQDGKTDYLAFCHDAARSGIEKWAVSVDEMTCSYFDKAGKKVLVEKIPAINL